jgi:hypothetical protein
MKVFPQIYAQLPMQVEECVVTSEMKKDGDYGISLWFNDTKLATSSISYGLEEYFSMVPEFSELTENAVRCAIKHTEDTFVITQMQSQGHNATREYRHAIPFRRRLMHAWNKISEQTNLSFDRYLPAHLNRWIMPAVIDTNPHTAPTISCLKTNYDSTAKKHKFRFNPASQLFERNGIYIFE